MIKNISIAGAGISLVLLTSCKPIPSGPVLFDQYIGRSDVLIKTTRIQRTYLQGTTPISSLPPSNYSLVKIFNVSDSDAICVPQLLNGEVLLETENVLDQNAFSPVLGNGRVVYLLISTNSNWPKSLQIRVGHRLASLHRYQVVEGYIGSYIEDIPLPNTRPMRTNAIKPIGSSDLYVITGPNIPKFLKSRVHFLLADLRTYKHQEVTRHIFCFEGSKLTMGLTAQSLLKNGCSKKENDVYCCPFEK